MPAVLMSPPDTAATESRLRRDLIAGLGDGVAFGAMVGLGETYLPAFVLAVGLGEITAGLSASVPLLAGGIMQLVSLAAIRKLGSHRRWVSLCAALQALSFIPLVIAAVVGGIPAYAVLLVATMYWGAGLATGPAWNTWMGTLIPRPIRARYFAGRTRWQQGAVLIGFLVGGGALHFSRESGQVLTAFAVIFAAAGFLRLISAWFLTRQSEPVPVPPNMRRIPVTQMLHYFRHGNGGRLLIYIVAVQSVVQFSGPYFTPYMFRKLEMSYGDFVVLIAASFLAKVFALPTWGRYAQKLGAHRLLWIGGIGIVPVAGMWLFSDNLYWLIFIQLLGGVAWAAYELAFFLLFFESIPDDERTSVLTLYNLANTSAWVAGSLLGGYLLYLMGTTREAYLWLFGLSSIGRAIALVFLWRVQPKTVQAAGMGVRTVGVRPGSASIDTPILPSLPDQSDEAAEKRVKEFSAA